MAVTRYNKIALGELTSAVDGGGEIDVSNITTIDASEIMIIKRNGMREPFNTKKLIKCINWATGGDTRANEEILQDTKIKLHKEIKVTDMYKQLIITAVNKISLLQVEWEDIAAKLQLLAYHKDTWGISKRGQYPHLADVLKKGKQHYVYDVATINRLSVDEIWLLNDAIDPSRDYLFNYKSLTTFFDKYCMNYSKTKKLELPQFSYMRVAIALMIDEDNRIEKIIECYNALSTHQYTVATPIMMNALTVAQQLSSCVLNTVADDTHSILDVNKDLGLYSRYKGGTALDITALRSKGSFIKGVNGRSSGPVPFLKIIEATMKAFNQGGKRPGACAVYFPWWHLDVMDLLSLKSNGGTNENRARGLKFAIKLNQLFIDAVINDEDVCIFDPVDATSIIGVYGEEFNDAYAQLESSNVRRKVLSARTILEKIMKERTETGNIYIFHEENVNNVSMLNRYIGSSNLCAEIVLPSRPSRLINEEMLTNELGQTMVNKTYEVGEVALCNLSSINLIEWHKLDNEGKDKLVSTIIRMLDNTVDLATYPIKEGAFANKNFRYLGIGVLNYANLVASLGIKIDTQESLEFSAELFDDISYRIISASCELSKEKGRFPRFNETLWAKGIVPVMKANKVALALTTYQPDMVRWEKLGKDISLYGLRNAQLMAIAPTATSGKGINATESIEPIQDFLYKEEGTITVTTLVPQFRQNNRFYVKAFDCDQLKLLELAAVRQIYLDQSQSVNMYIRKPDSLIELTYLHLKAFDMGVKTLYYVKQLKGGEEEVCESCT